ncbi:DEAD/DEAH box helicase family protein [Lactococcus garvieae]|uniref:DEAD/DEAH box helicase family protein n=1 Tax=Lactococcus garvieae TaxID=1363 RepID=UPI00254CD564|nr:DEAD/DEAH box helicase family protein [Lactococcus garvieae]
MAKKQKTSKKIELPLIKEITDFFGDYFTNQEDERWLWGKPKLPDYVSMNLKHDLREYQEGALHALNYTQRDRTVNSRLNHLLFHMATGSGKTDIMAAIMLYMYAELGYQNFLFVVNTNSVISKTKENLLNPASKKYLFASNMVINGQRLEIKEVATFPKNPEPGVIYLRLTTIQTLSNELGEGRENSLTYEDLAKQKMVILADEAHHFSADTKSGATPTEAKNSRAWESVLDRIRQGNAENRQFEFTATIDLAQVVVELQSDFASRNVINVNDSDRNSEGILADTDTKNALNSLEEPDNPFRVVFAVAKLSEGWDVLNLYDIVRISEGAPTSGKTLKNGTNSEAQLIGRGARYYPFAYEGEKSFQRRFDKTNRDLQVLEYLDYHTISEPAYLTSLKDSLDKMGLPVEDITDYDIFTAKVKPAFRRTQVFKTGKLYYNEVEEVPKEDWDSLSKYGIKIADIPKVDISQGVSESESVDESSKVETELATLELSYDNNVLLKKAIARNPFFRFNNLKGYLPNLKSMREFLDDANWLGAIPELNITLSKGQELTRERELQAVEKYLEYIQRAILMNYKKQRGTNKFVSVPVSEMVVDYEKRVATTSRKEISEVIMPHDAKKMDWFPHDKAVVDNLEWKLIEEVIQPHIAKLREEYEDVYLIRNDERLTQFALHDFGQNIQSYAGFMPDFILYLGSSSEIIQVYIEPKGQAFVYKDQWKEDLLTKIKQADIIVEDENVRLYGVKFYTGDNGREILNELDTLRSNGRSELVKSIEEEFENLL